MDHCSIEPCAKEPFFKVKVGDCKAEKKFYEDAFELFGKFALEIARQITDTLPMLLEKVAALPGKLNDLKDSIQPRIDSMSAF